MEIETGIEPTATEEKIKQFYDRHIDSRIVGYVQIEDGNKQFYDKYGAEILKKVVDKILSNLSIDHLIFRSYVLNEMGEICTLGKAIPFNKCVKIRDNDGNYLEVGLDVSHKELAELGIE